MQQLKLRFAGPDDLAQIKEWMANTPDADLGVLDYPSIRVVCAYNGQPQAYLPMQQALVLESVARNPQSDELTSAQALRDMVKAAELVASQSHLSEIMFIANDESVLKIAQSHGFEKLPWPVMRMRL